MRKVFILSLLLAGTAVLAEDEFITALERAKSVSKHVGIFQLSKYQIANPKFAATYYHLGILSDSTIADEHPIRNYPELKESLYRTRLYYGNCIHYAKDQTLKPQYYEDIKLKGKKLTYEDLYSDLSKRIAKVREQEKKAMELYNSYTRLVERYSLCRQLFTAFMEKYTREKNAHLFFNDTDRQTLTLIASQADSVEYDIKALHNALKKMPVSDYNPKFKFERINLYRLDGLSHTDILQNEVVLWDYAEWSRRFMKEHNDIYQSYYNHIDKEHVRLNGLKSNLANGKKVIFTKNEVLLNLIDRIDYGSFMRPFLELESQSVMLSAAAKNDILTSTTPVTEDETEKIINFLYLQYNAQKQADSYMQQIKTLISEEQTDKYRSLMEKWEIKDIDDILVQAGKYADLADMAYNEGSNAAYNRLSVLITPFEKYKNELTDEIVTADSLKYELEGEVVDILPAGENFIVVESGQRIVLVNHNGELVSSNTYDVSAAFEFAYKLTNNNIAILTKKRCIFVDNKGHEK